MAVKEIFTIEDRYSVKEVRVNGIKVSRAIYANTRRGIVRVWRHPFKMHKYGKRLLTKTIRGDVQVILREKKSHCVVEETSERVDE